VPSLDEWEKQWEKDPRSVQQPKVVAVDFQAQPARPETTQAQALLAPRPEPYDSTADGRSVLRTGHALHAER
jgi:hypothetical protein